MSASQKIDKNINNIKKLGVIAGGGDVPAYLVSACKKKNIEPFLVGFKGQTDSSLIDGNNNGLWSNVGSVGKIISFLKSNDVKDLVMIGNIKRPSLSEIKPDIKAVKILSKIGVKVFGDNSLLSALRGELENEGFEIHGFHNFCSEWLVKDGVLGNVSPQSNDKKSIDAGLKISQSIGALDIGQSIIIQDGIIIGVEAVEGTDNLMKRCKILIKKGRGGILVKTCKPNQDKAFDLPTIGVNTINNAKEAGLVGIVIEADNAIIVEPDKVSKYADRYGIFVLGVSLH